VMLTNDTMKTLEFIDQNHIRGVIAAPNEISTLIPAFTSSRVIVGHPTFTFQPDLKQHDLDAIYWQSDINLVKKAIDSKSITYVWAPNWMIHSNFLVTLGFKSIYSNQTVTLYEKSNKP
jgi:hypothetical protein